MKSDPKVEISKSPIISTDNLDDIEKMERCRRELDALKKIGDLLYNKRKAEFDKLISGASIYNGVRNEVANYTQNAVDAYYRFRADKLCADISNDVLNGLTETH
ncbi:Uncharacterised protein [Citrobacter freundii]|nr:Uncharacterised protein [Citrobacter freundii]